MDTRISMITLGVRDLDAAIRFYRDGLGFPKMESPPEVAFFTLNGTWLGLYGLESLADDAGVSPDRSGFAGFALAHNVESEGEVEAILSRASEYGAEITKPAAHTEWGGYSGYFADLDGYQWEIALNPHFWVGPPKTGG
ncbi:fosfomycin resistance protein FosB [Stieleria maiorica]|uniref:Fosfomycin resistance protein FosB n=1 Tax=Stieleria maiorica TaxID=2795974 RepID=A0A5B9MAD5_9BACT|nr:VOC family protein [Stieleria maiorica]QEF97196.1 fosfomycin resistance protein FosB [Stieleria maiorica]